MKSDYSVNDFRKDAITIFSCLVFGYESLNAEEKHCAEISCLFHNEPYELNIVVERRI